MKNVIMRKLMPALLVLVLMISTILTGCSSSKKGTDTETKEDSITATTPDKDTEGKSDEIVELDIFINESWWPSNSFTGIIPETITEKTGVKFNITVAADSNQLGVMIGSDELPDIVFSSAELNRLSNSSLCYSYDELTDLYGYEFNASEEQVNIAKSLSEDGKNYCLLDWYNTKDEWENLKVGAPGQACIFYRKDLYEKMGSPEINNLDDFMKVLELCKTTYPDMIPMGLGGFWKFNSISTWIGQDKSTYDGENFFYTTSTNKYKEYLKYCNTLARDGYVTVESYANENEADSHQAAYNSNCVFYPWYLTVGNLNQLQAETEKITPDAEWAVLKPLGEKSFTTGKGWAGAFVSKKCKNPEAAAKAISFLFSEEGQRLTLWGREGTDYTVNDQDLPVFSADWLETRKDPAAMTAKYNTWFYLGSSQIISLYADYSGLAEDVVAQFTPYGEGYSSYPEVGIAEPNSSSDEGIIKTKLEEVRKSMEAKIIFAGSDEEFDSSYEELMSACKQIGVDTYNEYMTNKIKEVKEQFGF